MLVLVFMSMLMLVLVSMLMIVVVVVMVVAIMLVMLMIFVKMGSLFVVMGMMLNCCTMLLRVDTFDMSNSGSKRSNMFMVVLFNVSHLMLTHLFSKSILVC
jgi:hypothetical protein